MRTWPSFIALRFLEKVRISAVIIGLGVMAIAASYLILRTGGNGLSRLLQGSRDVTISKMEIRGYYQGFRKDVVITNGEDLAFLSEAFRRGSNRVRTSGFVFDSKFYLNSSSSTRSIVIIPADAHSLIIGLPTFLSIRDPEYVEIPLGGQMPHGLMTSIQFLLSAPQTK